MWHNQAANHNYCQSKSPSKASSSTSSKPFQSKRDQLWSKLITIIDSLSHHLKHQCQLFSHQSKSTEDQDRSIKGTIKVLHQQQPDINTHTLDAKFLTMLSMDKWTP